MVQLAIAWAMRLPIISCVLVGAKSPAQVEEHLGAVEVTFSDDELEHIKGILAEAPRVTPETPLRNSTR